MSESLWVIFSIGYKGEKMYVFPQIFVNILDINHNSKFYFDILLIKRKVFLFHVIWNFTAFNFIYWTHISSFWVFFFDDKMQKV